jgi:hypothetical protein
VDLRQLRRLAGEQLSGWASGPLKWSVLPGGTVSGCGSAAKEDKLTRKIGLSLEIPKRSVQDL